MLDIMEGVEDYDNMGALLGIDGSDNEELLGALKRMNPIARQKAVNKLASTGGKSRGSRAEMEKHFAELPPHIKSALGKGELRLADTIIYSFKKVSSRTTKLWETQDTKTIGINSLSGAKLPKNQALLVSGIILLAGVPAGATPDDIMSANYDRIENFPAIVSGEFNIKANKKVIMPETSNYMFRTANNSTLPLGYYKLANPRLIHDDVLIEATVELGSVAGLNPNTFIFLGLHGTITTP
ncbi:MAG TPA: hypothetical protein PL029_03595 [Bacteroidia bacterium]|nr:hypothetical protein [Bacteroidia bacterium]